jgi:glycosyltransferase involved in cell wall biosynthesis
LERRLTKECDFVTVPGPADVASVQRNARGQKPILVIPNVVRIGQGQPRQPTSASLDALFVGSTHGPNVDGLRWLLAEVWPTVQEQSPGAQLTVIGRGLSHEMLFRDSLPRAAVEFVQEVEDLEPIYSSAKVVLIPLFYGSGVPNKVLEALATDSAVILTAYVAEALGRPSGLKYFEGASSWIQAIIEALADPACARINSVVRAPLLAAHGPDGFDRAMHNAVDLVRKLDGANR